MSCNSPWLHRGFYPGAGSHSGCKGPLTRVPAGVVTCFLAKVIWQNPKITGNYCSSHQSAVGD